MGVCIYAGGWLVYSVGMASWAPCLLMGVKGGNVRHRADKRKPSG